MATNKTNPGMNIEDYEDKAMRRSKIAKRVALGAAGAVGVAGIAGGTAYAATTENQSDELLDEPLTAQDMIDGGDVTSEYEAEPEPVTQYVYVEKQPEPEPEPNITWDETTNVNVNGETIMTVQEGTVDGHHFELGDVNADGYADYVAIDMNDNGHFEEDELYIYQEGEQVSMNNQTAHTTDKELIFDNNGGMGLTGENTNDIHNNFEDEKTGEYYHGDYAENNPDYNNHAGENMGYRAEMETEPEYDGYPNEGVVSDDERYMAMEDDYESEPNVDMTGDVAEEAIEDDSFDQMNGTDEFMG